VSDLLIHNLIKKILPIDASIIIIFKNSNKYLNQMGNFFSLVWALYWHDELRKPFIDPEEPLYTVPDPN